MEFELICLHRDARERIDATFRFPVLLISIGSKSGTPFLSEPAKACQHYFANFLTRMQKDTLPPNKPSSVAAATLRRELRECARKKTRLLNSKVIFEPRITRMMPIFAQRVAFGNSGRADASPPKDGFAAVNLEFAGRPVGN